MEKNKNNTVFSFTKAYDIEVTPERIEKLKIEVNEIENVEQKIAFLKNKKIEYLQSISPQILEASGMTSLPNFRSGEALFFDRIIQLEIKKYEQEFKPKSAEKKTDKLTAPVIGLFCTIINNIGVDKKEDTESASAYCERICFKFKLPYTDRVRQNYNVSETRKLIKELNEKLLPLIDTETKTLVENYLDSKQPPKQKLYA